MPRGKRRAESQPEAEMNPAEQSGTESAAETPPQQIPAESGPADESAPPESEPQAASPRGQFRSWFVDTRRGYTGLTDEIHHCLVLQFEQKPHPDVLAAVKGAGFQFKPDHYGLKNVWIRRNDFEGRVQVETITKLIRGVLGEPETLSH